MGASEHYDGMLHADRSEISAAANAAATGIGNGTSGGLRQSETQSIHRYVPNAVLGIIRDIKTDFERLISLPSNKINGADVSRTTSSGVSDSGTNRCGFGLIYGMKMSLGRISKFTFGYIAEVRSSAVAGMKAKDALTLTGKNSPQVAETAAETQSRFLSSSFYKSSVNASNSIPSSDMTKLSTGPNLELINLSTESLISRQQIVSIVSSAEIYPVIDEISACIELFRSLPELEDTRICSQCSTLKNLISLSS